jgi:HlyD family secretion protein
VVVGILAYPGQVVSSGSPVLTLEPSGETLDLTMWVPAEGGKNVRPGMAAQVMPSTVPVEEYGFIRGTVTSVAPVPSTPADMQAILQNQYLVDQLSRRGALVRVTVTLQQADAAGAAPAGAEAYVWSSSRGPDAPVTSGTLCAARIVLGEQAPITLVIPALDRVLHSQR